MASVEEGRSEGPQALEIQGMECGQESEPQLKKTPKKFREEIWYSLGGGGESMPCFSSPSFYGPVFSSAAALVLKLQGSSY